MNACLQPDLPGLPLVEMACRCCGGIFASPAKRKRGRPVAFCSTACRRLHADELRRAWHAQQNAASAPAGLTCWSCGAPFEALPRMRGRSPRFCSHECRTADKLAKQRRAKARQRRAGLASEVTINPKGKETT